MLSFKLKIPVRICCGLKLHPDHHRHRGGQCGNYCPPATAFKLCVLFLSVYISSPFNFILSSVCVCLCLLRCEHYGGFGLVHIIQWTALVFLRKKCIQVWCTVRTEWCRSNNKVHAVLQSVEHILIPSVYTSLSIVSTFNSVWETGCKCF